MNKRHFLITCCLLFMPLISHAADIAVWPINPSIAPGELSTAIWLRNNGNETITLQTRIFHWQHDQQEDQLLPQQYLVPSPAMIDIAPGQQQMVRLVSKIRLPKENNEQRYRVIVDEIPRDQEQKNQAEIRYKVRYSIPLFVGVDKDFKLLSLSKNSNYAAEYKIDPTPNSAIIITNHLPITLRIANLQIHGAQKEYIAQGLLGYIHPKSHRRFEIPEALAKKLTQEKSSLVFEQEHLEIYAQPKKQ